ncbi:hypothetical protein AVEN_266102-1 [Araneus ventricosus]|uniref:Uncharacterized protein n=1 Tax=Araneus ventricosus TaxID=182803 RepID=A0A4Y2R9M6_ARAVE|nr:hypothetical protein AVEN_266102-1 [Araneus ventricosus]
MNIFFFFFHGSQHGRPTPRRINGRGSLGAYYRETKTETISCPPAHAFHRVEDTIAQLATLFMGPLSRHERLPDHCTGKCHRSLVGDKWPALPTFHRHSRHGLMRHYKQNLGDILTIYKFKLMWSVRYRLTWFLLGSPTLCRQERR